MSGTEYTVGELRRAIEGIRDDTKLSFGGGLTFYRVKRVADDEVYIEWGEPQADLDQQFRKKNPHVKVAFISLETVGWEEGGIIGSVDVSIR